MAWTAPGYVPPVFRDGSFGRAGPSGSNARFLRPDSVLVVLMIAEVDDCSTPDSELVAESTNEGARFRCHVLPDRRYPVDRYARGLVGLRRFPSRVVLGLMAGIPDRAEEQTPTEILGRAEMIERPDPLSTAGLAAVCTSAEGLAEPARRMIGVGEAVAAAGGHVAVSQVCSSDTLSLGFERRVLAATLDAMQGTP